MFLKSNEFAFSKVKLLQLPLSVEPAGSQRHLPHVKRHNENKTWSGGTTAWFVRSQRWCPISSCISWAWSEASTGRGEPWKAAVLGHGVGNRNRLSGGAWSPLLVIRAIRCSQNPPEIPSWPLRFLGNASQKKNKRNKWFLFPWEGCLPPGSSVVPVTDAYFSMLSPQPGTREVYIVLKSWNGIQNLMHVRTGFFF